MTNKTQALIDALKSIAANTCCDTCQEAKLVAQEVLAALELPRLETCPKCGGIADNGHDRELPPNPYLCSKCEQPAVSEGELAENCAERLWMRDYPRGGSAYKTYESTNFHDKELYRKEIKFIIAQLRNLGVLTNVIWEDGK